MGGRWAAREGGARLTMHLLHDSRYVIAIGPPVREWAPRLPGLGLAQSPRLLNLILRAESGDRASISLGSGDHRMKLVNSSGEAIFQGAGEFVLLNC